jgi:hypothetical protein
MLIKDMVRLGMGRLEFLLAGSLVLALIGNPPIATAGIHLSGGGSEALDVQVTLLGYLANQGGGGAIDAAWTTGNLGNTWDEGEWVPYELMYEYVEAGLIGLDSIIVSFDFLVPGAYEDFRFIDLVRGLQVGTVSLANDQGWVGADGNALPVSTREEIEAAQTYPLEHAWNGFTLLDLPNERVNRTHDGGLDVPPGEERHTFKIYKSDLLAAGIDINDSTVVLYWQLHESRTLVWKNRFQAGYDAPPADRWGGYLYGTDGWPTAEPLLGSGYVPGASGYVRVVSIPGTRVVPIPIPQPPLGTVSGYKWSDDDGDGVWDAAEPGLSGWRIHLCGTVECIDVALSTLTDGTGYYAFGDLSPGTPWLIKEDEDRYDPPEAGYGQTYPTLGTTYGQGTAVAVGPPPPGVANLGWEVELTVDISDQDGMNFGNDPIAGTEEGLYGFHLGMAHPNPFRDATVITYSVPGPSKVHLTVWSVNGELVRTLIDAEVGPGPHHMTWNGQLKSGEKLPPGIYLCRLQAGGHVMSRKIVLVE